MTDPERCPRACTSCRRTSCATAPSDAIAFYAAAFGAQEMMRLPGEDGRLMHAAISVNGSSVMLVDENREYGLLSPKALGGTPVDDPPDRGRTSTPPTTAPSRPGPPRACRSPTCSGAIATGYWRIRSVTCGRSPRRQRVPMTPAEMADAAASAPPM